MLLRVVVGVVIFQGRDGAQEGKAFFSKLGGGGGNTDFREVGGRTPRECWAWCHRREDPLPGAGNRVELGLEEMVPLLNLPIGVELCRIGEWKRKAAEG